MANPLLLPGLLALGLAGMAGLAWLSWRLEQKREARWRATSSAHGWTWVDRDDRYVGRWDGPPFARGSRRRALDVVTGWQRGRPLCAFTYSWQTTSTDGQGHTTTTTHYASVVALSLPAYLPAVSITRENVFTRVGRLVGLADLEFESEAFNRRFRVSAEDPRTASDLLGPRAMERLLAAPDDLSFRVDGADLLCWATGRQDPDDVVPRADLLADLVDLVPSFVWTDRSRGQENPTA